MPNPEMVFKVYVSRGAVVAEPPAKKLWGMLEFSLRDPDGHLLRIRHPLK